MKLSKAEWAAVAVAAGLLLFFGGWALRGALLRPGTYVISAQTPDTKAPPAVRESFVPDARLDLNAATQADLEGLPGIGAVRAAAIVAYREEHGPFARVEDLTQVSGIGPSTLEALKDYITVKEADPS